MDRKGYTLMEVLVAFVILLMVSQILLLGMMFCKKIEKKTNVLEATRREIGIHLLEKTDCISGTVRLEMEEIGEDLECEGWLYTGNNAVDMEIIWVETDLQIVIDKNEAEEAPEE